jgi:hypothetical protein
VNESAEGSERKERRWIRAALLVLPALVFPSLTAPGLMTIPFVMLATLLPRKGSRILAFAALALLITLTAIPPSGGLWYVQRGWALVLGGWFVALTLRWPSSSFTARALGSVFGSAAAATLYLVRSPDALGALDALVKVRITEAGVVLEAAVQAASDPEVAETMAAMVESTTQAWQHLYPGALLIASLCGLAVAWWGYVRLAQGSDLGLGPLRDFRFNDQLVWIAIAAVALLLWEAPEFGNRLGANALLFMSALYAARGAAVVVFVMGGVSLTGGVLFTLAMLLVAPYVLSLAVFIGLGDTWLHVRERAVSALAGGTQRTWAKTVRKT